MLFPEGLVDFFKIISKTCKESIKKEVAKRPMLTLEQD